MLSSVWSAALVGVDAVPVEIETHFRVGLPGYAVVGLPQVSVRESRERVLSAIRSSGLQVLRGAAVARYRGRVSGPMLDRMDLVVDFAATWYRELRSAADRESSSVVRARVESARRMATDRRQDVPNARLIQRKLDSWGTLGPKGHRLLQHAVDRLGMTARGVTRVRRVGRSIADLAGSAEVRAEHVAEAVQYRG